MRSRSPKCCSPVSPRHRATAVVLTCAFALAGHADATTPPARTLIAVGDITSCETTDDDRTAALVSRIPGTIAVLGDIAYENGIDKPDIIRTVRSAGYSLDAEG